MLTGDSEGEATPSHDEAADHALEAPCNAALVQVGRPQRVAIEPKSEGNALPPHRVNNIPMADSSTLLLLHCVAPETRSRSRAKSIVGGLLGPRGRPEIRAEPLPSKGRSRWRASAFESTAHAPILPVLPST